MSQYYANKGEQAYVSSDVAGAGILFEKALRFGENVAARYYLGRIALGKADRRGDVLFPDGNYKSAIDHLEKSISLGLASADADIYADALFILGIAYWMDGKHEAADRNFLSMIAVAPEKSDHARYFLAYDYFAFFNKPREALDLLNEIKNAASAEVWTEDWVKIESLLSRLSLYFDDYENAETYAGSVLSKTNYGSDFYSVNAHLVLAQVRGKNGDFVSMEEEIGKANELLNKPHYTDCVAALGYYLGEKYEKAILSAKGALTYNQDQYARSICLYVLGKSYLASKDKVNAKKYFDDFLELTDQFLFQNVFTARNRDDIKAELAGL